MPIPIGTEFNVEVTRPIDSRMVWTGTFDTLNTIPNRYPGLSCYITGDKNLYVFQGSNIWEKVVTNNVDSTTFDNTLTIFPYHNGQVLYVSGTNPITVGWPTFAGNYPTGFNVSIVQEGPGAIQFQSVGDINIVNRSNLFNTAGLHAIVSILRVKNTNKFLLYGDLV